MSTDYAQAATLLRQYAHDLATLPLPATPLGHRPLDPMDVERLADALGDVAEALVDLEAERDKRPDIDLNKVTECRRHKGASVYYDKELDDCPICRYQGRPDDITRTTVGSKRHGIGHPIPGETVKAYNARMAGTDAEITDLPQTSVFDPWYPRRCKDGTWVFGGWVLVPADLTEFVRAHTGVARGRVAR